MNYNLYCFKLSKTVFYSVLQHVVPYTYTLPHVVSTIQYI